MSFQVFPTASFCEWLTKLFGIPFKPVIVETAEQLTKLNNAELDFSGNIMPSEERTNILFMTDAIAERQIVMLRMEGSRSIDELLLERPVKLAFLTNSPLETSVSAVMECCDYEVVWINSFADAYRAIATGEADAYVMPTISETYFADYDDVIIEEFSPLIFTQISMAASKTRPELETIISLVTKALRGGALPYISRLYRQGYEEYLRHKTLSMLTEEERAYIKNKPVIPIGAYSTVYPVSFFDTRYQKWDGFYFDVLDQVSLMTGWSFEIANEPHMITVPELINMMRNSEICILPDVAWSRERDEFINWSDKSLMTDYYALVSSNAVPDLALNDIQHYRIGLGRNTNHAALFMQWFPHHPNIQWYGNLDLALDALIRDEVDLVMSSQRRVMYLTHFRELAGYKANFVFNYPIETRIAFCAHEPLLQSIFDKVINNIDTDKIVDKWMHRAYDYRAQLAEAQRPWLYGAAILSLVILVLVIIIFVIFYRNRKKSEKAAVEKLREAKERQKILESIASKEHEANQLKSRFLATMSHEIRTPMNAILGVTELELQNKEHPPATCESLERIYESGTLLLNIINDILDLSQIEAGKMEILPVNYDLPSLINDAVQICRVRYENKPIEFLLDIDENSPLNLYGDELRINQILNNIITNAFKYTDEGQIKLSVCAESVQGSGAGDTVIMVFRVSDTGQGMTKEQVNVLFEEYTRFNIDSNRTTTGTGIGMNITKHLLDLMGGEISVESEPGKGSVFTVRLPQKRTDTQVCDAKLIEEIRNFRFQNDTSKRGPSQILYEHMPYGSVLVVDDISSNRYVAKGLLRPYGVKLDSASSGFEAIEKIKNGNVYDIIFMDHMMPKMDGMEAVKTLREMGYKNTIIALTANAFVGESEKYIKAGFDGYLSKPIDSRELNFIMNKFIRDRKKNEAAAARVEQYKKREAEIANNIRKNTASVKLSELEEFFLLDAESALSVLKAICGKSDAFTDQDANVYEITVHGMKSALANIGEKSLSELAYKLEKRVMEKDFAAVQSETPAFLEALKDLVMVLQTRK